MLFGWKASPRITTLFSLDCYTPTHVLPILLSSSSKLMFSPRSSHRDPWCWLARCCAVSVFWHRSCPSGGGVCCQRGNCLNWPGFKEAVKQIQIESSFLCQERYKDFVSLSTHYFHWRITGKRGLLRDTEGDAICKKLFASSEADEELGECRKTQKNVHVRWCCCSSASCFTQRKVHFQLVAVATALRAVSDAVTQWPKHSSALHHPTTSPSPSPHAAFFHTSLSFVLDTHQIFRSCILLLLLLFSLSLPPLSPVLIGLQDCSLQSFLSSSSFQGLFEKSAHRQRQKLSQTSSKFNCLCLDENGRSLYATGCLCWRCFFFFFSVVVLHFIFVTE